jgi:hypothetical protein
VQLRRQDGSDGNCSIPNCQSQLAGNPHISDEYGERRAISEVLAEQRRSLRHFVDLSRSGIGFGALKGNSGAL